MERSAPEVRALEEAAKQRREEEHQRWQAAHEEWERKEAERRRAEAEKASHQELLAIIDEWAVARRIEAFFADVERSAAALPTDNRVAVLDRVAAGRAVVGEADALPSLLRWKTVPERIGEA
jgi:hypothetical protein